MWGGSKHGWLYSYLRNGLTIPLLVSKRWEGTCMWKTDIPWEWMDIRIMWQTKWWWRPINLDRMVLHCIHTCHMFCNLLMCLASRVSRRHSKNIEILEHWGMGAKNKDLASWMAWGLNRALAQKNNQGLIQIITYGHWTRVLWTTK